MRCKKNRIGRLTLLPGPFSQVFARSVTVTIFTTPLLNCIGVDPDALAVAILVFFFCLGIVAYSNSKTLLETASGFLEALQVVPEPDPPEPPNPEQPGGAEPTADTPEPGPHSIAERVRHAGVLTFHLCA